VPPASALKELATSAATARPNGSGQPQVRPATASGGTNEMAMATPGRVSEISGRASATEPTDPVASAATRSTSRG
jgi:hypothetical protein